MLVQLAAQRDMRIKICKHSVRRHGVGHVETDRMPTANDLGAHLHQAVAQRGR
jgi:hypothetical protein